LDTDKTIRRERIHDEKTVVKKKPGSGKKKAVKKAAKTAKKEAPKQVNLAFARSKVFKDLCMRAGKAADANQRQELQDLFRVLVRNSKFHLENPVPAKIVHNEKHWQHIDRVFTQLRYGDLAKNEKDRREYPLRAQTLAFRWAAWLGITEKAKQQLLFQALRAEYELRKTKKKIFEVLEEVLGEEFTKDYIYSEKPELGELPELTLETRRLPPKKPPRQ
jgi:hypothetical protein